MSSVVPSLSFHTPSTPGRAVGVALPPGVEAPLAGGAEAPAQSFSFSDFLSVLNPLQHIPVVGTIYRAITGDTIAPTARVLGGALFGGPVGLIASAFNAVIEQATGSDLGDKVLAQAGIDRKTPAEDSSRTAYAAAMPQASPTVATTASPVAGNTESPAIVGETTELAREPSPPPPAAPSLPVHSARVRSAAPPNDGSPRGGRTLADYQSFAGRPLPTVDSTRSVSNAPPVRLQTTGPMTPERGRTPILPAAPAVPTTTTAEPAATAEAATGNPPPTHWFQAAMMKGLDRYRDNRRADAPVPAPRIDTTL